MRSGLIDDQRDILFSEGSAFAPVLREEIVGIDEVVERVDEIAGYLRNAAVYERHGARLEGGVAFCGAPGSGKTLLARYLATVCGALFVNMRELPREQTQLVGADVADAFRRARGVYRERGRAVLLFWDEFDDHTAPIPNPHAPEREVVSQLRAELDGVSGKAYGVLLVGCTNRPLAEALIRPGRMSQILFGPPDRAGKAELLRHGLSRLTCAGELDTEELSYLYSSHASASEVAESVADAWFRATRRSVREGSDPSLCEDDLRAVLLDRLIGAPPPWAEAPERLRVAVHELGHALVALAYGIPVTLVTVRPGSIGAGMVMFGDCPGETVEDHLNRLAVGLGATVAERIAGLGIGLGNGNDTCRATGLATGVVHTHGVGERSGLFNPTPLGCGDHGVRPVSQEFLGRLDQDAFELLEEAETNAERILERVGRERLLELADALVERETLLRLDVETLLWPSVADELEPAWDD